MPSVMWHCIPPWHAKYLHNCTKEENTNLPCKNVESQDLRFVRQIPFQTKLLSLVALCESGQWPCVVGVARVATPNSSVSQQLVAALATVYQEVSGGDSVADLAELSLVDCDCGGGS